MKKFIKFITENMRQVLLIVVVCTSGGVMAQRGTQPPEEFGNIKKSVNLTSSSQYIGAKKDYTQNACGFYPASGVRVQAISTTYGGNGCATVITSGSSTVYFTAKDKVILLPGFIAREGSHFIACVEACSSGLVPPTQAMSDARKDIKTSVALEAGISQEAALANAKTDESITVAPNPFSGSFVLSINANKYGRARVAIYNSFGGMVKELQQVNLVKGFNNLSFNGSNFASGVYMLEVNFGDS
ncbi:MAG TPA: T9SS type A sorting domain-containing protein, partial [Parafilimonas sp.]|nr:T9SS type A sorting domain-containing protein [Parafilimonas sp.]